MTLTLLNIFEKYYENVVLLDALYQWADNPTSMSAKYGIADNKSHIEKNLGLRYGILFQLEDFNELYYELEELSEQYTLSYGKYGIDNLRSDIREKIEEKIESRFIKGIIEKIKLANPEMKLFIYSLVLAIEKEEYYDQYSLAKAFYFSMVDLKPPSLEELIIIGLVNELYWISSSKKNPRKEEKLVFPKYIKRASSEIKEIISFPSPKIDPSEYIASLAKVGEYEQFRLLEDLIEDDGIGYLRPQETNYDDLRLINGIIGKNEQYIVISPNIFNMLKEVIDKWKRNQLKPLKVKLENVIAALKQKYSIYFESSWMEDWRRLEYTNHPQLF